MKKDFIPKVFICGDKEKFILKTIDKQQNNLYHLCGFFRTQKNF